MIEEQVESALSARRFVELDVLRGFAVVGIFIINIIYFAQPVELSEFPTLIGRSETLNAYAWFFSSLWVEGAMYGLFAMLFGASSLLLLDDKKLTSSSGVWYVESYYRRMLWLIAFGLVHAFLLLSPMDILFTYGVLGLVLFPLRNIKPVYLFVSGVAFISWGVFSYSLSIEPAQVALDTVAEAVQSPGATIKDSIIASYQTYTSPYADIFRFNAELAFSWISVNFFEDHIFDAGGMMLVGMALFKWGVLTGRRSTAFYVFLAVSGYVLTFLLRWPGRIMFYSSGFDPGVNAELLYGPVLMSRVFLVLGHVGLLLSLYKTEIFNLFFRLLASTGKMALTNYITQTLFAVFLFYGFGLGQYGQLERYQLLSVALLFATFQIVISAIWLQVFRYGPFEWLWRSLVRMQRQQFIRTEKFSKVITKHLHS